MTVSSSQTTNVLDGMSFEPPAGFERVETMLSWRAAVKQELRDPRLVQGILNKQSSIQPNLIAHQRKAKANASLEQIVGEACAEFVRSMVNLQNIKRVDFRFDDQNEGFLVTFDLPATSSQTLRQFHVFRLDGGILTSMTLTTDALTLTEEQTQSYLANLRTLQPAA